jgi:parallel beta-helix repeat protein
VPSARALGNVLNVRESDPITGAPPARGTGGPSPSEDDTVAFQRRLDVLGFLGGGALFVPFGRYRLTAPLTLSSRVQIVGEGGAARVGDQGGPTPSYLVADHTGTVVDIPAGAEYCTVRNLVFVGREGTGDSSTLYVGGPRTVVDGCSFFRGGIAAVRMRSGMNTFANNWIEASQSPWSGDRGHGLWMESTADSFVTLNQIAAHGVGIYMGSANSNNIENNLVFNSYQGIVMAGATRNRVVGNRLDEHTREGLVVDWNSHQNQIVGNIMFSNGARVDGTVPLLERAGMRLRSGWANTVSGNTFGNFDRGATQEGGALDFRRPQHYGLVILGAESPGDANAAPHHNLVTGNTFDDQRGPSLVNFGAATNVVRTNVGPDFAD